MLKGSSFILASIAGFIFLVFAYGRIGLIEMDKSILIVIGLFIMLYSARAFEVEMKYQSPKFVSDPVHSTANWSDTRLVGNYAVIRLGAFDAFGFKSRGGNEGTAVVRMDGITKTGESIATTCKLSEIGWDELPPEVYKQRDKLGLTMPLYRGDLSDDEGLKRSKYGAIEIEIREKDKTINTMKDILSGKTGVIEEYIESQSRIMERKKGIGGFLQSLGFNTNEEKKQEGQ